MSPSWRSTRAQHEAQKHVTKVRQFGLIPLNDIVDEQCASARDGFLESGVWALQNPSSILRAIARNEEFSVVVGMRPGMTLHLGHLSLIRELGWLVSLGGRPIIVFAAHEADAISNENKREDSFAHAFESFNGFPLPADTITVTDRESPTLLHLESRIADVISVREIMRLYGWKASMPINRFRDATMTAAAFLLSSDMTQRAPRMVLSDINQVTHAEIAKIAAQKLHLQAPSVSYRILLPSLRGPDGRMTVRDSRSTIFFDDEDENARAKLSRSFTGGRATVQEQRRVGGEPEKCSFFRAAEALQINPQDSSSMHARCITGAVSCGECKQERLPTLLETKRLLRKN
jgi:tryptophanyl-tRNA synthetase